MTKRLAPFYVLAALVAFTGCSATESGTATPAPAVAGPPSPFNGLQACPVLDQALAGKGFPRGVKETSGGPNGCGAEKPQFGSVGLVLDAEQGLDQFPAAPNKTAKGNVNGRRALLEREALGDTGDCGVAMEVSSTAIVRADVKLINDTNQACELAKTVAERVETQLPRS